MVFKNNNLWLKVFSKATLRFFKPKDCKANLFVKPKPSKLQTIGPTDHSQLSKKWIKVLVSNRLIVLDDGSINLIFTRKIYIMR